MSEWKTMESAPKDGTAILACAANGPHSIIRITWWRRREDRAGYIGWGEFNKDYWPPTHWMPLPEAPNV